MLNLFFSLFKVIPTAFVTGDHLNFKPKFGFLQLTSNPMKHSPVIITYASTPTEIYVLIEDEDDFAHFRRMQEDLQQEFSTATKHSPTYCSSPIAGNIIRMQTFIYSFTINYFIYNLFVKYNFLSQVTLMLSNLKEGNGTEFSLRCTSMTNYSYFTSIRAFDSWFFQQ